MQKNARLTAENASNYSKLSEPGEEKARLESLLDAKMERWVYLNELAENIASYEENRKRG